MTACAYSLIQSISCNAKSNTTRIETCPLLRWTVTRICVATLNPIQQGLKRDFFTATIYSFQRVATLNPIQQGLKRDWRRYFTRHRCVATLNPIQQGLKHALSATARFCTDVATLNPIQQGLKHKKKQRVKKTEQHVATLNPIQQGLKHKVNVATLSAMMVATLNPIQQGLKLCAYLRGFTVYFSCNAKSNTTRIETRQQRLSCQSEYRLQR